MLLCFACYYFQSIRYGLNFLHGKILNICSFIFVYNLLSFYLHFRIVLILITSYDACNDCHVSNLLDNIFAAMAMIIGIDALLKQDSIRLQKAAVVSTYYLVSSFRKFKVNF